MQIKRNSVWVAMIGFVYLAIGCQDKQMSDLYKSTLQKNESGAIIAKSGKYELRQNQSSFARENFSVINGKEVVELPTNLKRLVLNTLMLRKLAIQDGLTQGIFDTTDAKDYVLPRLEKILEDYYYYKLSNEKVWVHQLYSIQNDKDALRAFIQNDVTLQKKSIREAELSAAMSEVIGRVIAEKRVVEYSKIKQQILRKNPPIEIIP